MLVSYELQTTWHKRHIKKIQKMGETEETQHKIKVPCSCFNLCVAEWRVGREKDYDLITTLAEKQT